MIFYFNSIFYNKILFSHSIYKYIKLFNIMVFWNYFILTFNNFYLIVRFAFLYSLLETISGTTRKSGYKCSFYFAVSTLLHSTLSLRTLFIPCPLSDVTRRQMRKGSFPFASLVTRNTSKVSVVSRRVLRLRALILIGLLENGRHNSGRQVWRDWMENFWRRYISLGALRH